MLAIPSSQSHPKQKNDFVSACSVSRQVTEFLNTPFYLLENRLRSLGLKETPIQLTPNILARFTKFFHSPANKNFLEDYVHRCDSPMFSNLAPVQEMACYIYSKILLSVGQKIQTEDLRLVVYAVSLNLAQKFLLDREVFPESMAKMLGMPLKQLNMRDIFIMNKFFGFWLQVDKEIFNRFRSYIRGFKSQEEEIY